MPTTPRYYPTGHQTIKILTSIKIPPFALLLLMSILGLIAAVLIAPTVDLPDTAFQRDGAPLSIHALSHSAPKSSEGISASISPIARLDLSHGHLQITCFDSESADRNPSVPCRILRC